MSSKHSSRRKTGVRLSKNVIPTKYDLQIHPDMENFTFEGVETISLSISRKVKSLTLHAKELQIETASITIDSQKIFASNIKYDAKSETVTLVFKKSIPVSRAKLTLVFKGIINDKMRGFYRSKYNALGKTCYLATTQFEATDARRAFPCFDEPSSKAVFHVCIVVPKGRTAISNTLPISVREHSAGYDIVRFSPTPKMSTYLLAFIIGDFEYLEAKTARGVLVRVYTTEGKKHQARFALECAVKTLEFYEKYFDIAYPLNTLDMVAIPDFQAGAMENWGAITYRESALLVDDDHSSASNKQWVALVIAHELAHQWFGNLVTMEWWTHLWLNEGFASYIEYLAVDKLFPKWDIWTQFSNNDLGIALRLDSLATTHPIEVHVHHPDEIGEIFDEVSYSKGASIIRMLAGYLGERNFRDGLRYYLKKHSYKNTETIHLWQAFEKISGLPVAKVMKNWTSKPGYPMVKARMLKGKVNFSQSRFFSSPISSKRAKDKTKWEIPIIFKKNKVNFGETGFYRTAYSPEMLEKLKIPVLKKTLPPRDRLGLIRDLFASAESGDVPTVYALEFLTNYTKEDNYTVWVEILQGLGRLEQILSRTKAGIKSGALLDPYIIKLFTPIATKLGWKKRRDESHADTILRPLVMSRLGRSGDKKTINVCRAEFAKIVKGGQVDPDIRGAVYAVVASQGGMREYRTLISRYIAEDLHEEKNRLGAALGGFPDPKILRQVCEFAVSDNVRPQDTIGILSSVALHPAGRSVWISFIKKNWGMLVSRYGDGGHTLSRLVKAISPSAEKKHLESIRKFFKTHKAPGAQRAIAQVLERLEGNIAWRERDEKSIKKFLRGDLK